jgi:hypothetical protein
VTGAVVVQVLAILSFYRGVSARPSRKPFSDLPLGQAMYCQVTTHPGFSSNEVNPMYLTNAAARSLVQLYGEILVS